MPCFGENIPMRILIADDESIIRLGLKTILQQMGHEVIAAMDGREAIQMARRQPPDLAILDVKMPYTDGLQAAQALYRTRPLPIILLTAYSDQDLIEKATDLPIHGYLVKPVQPSHISAAIAVAVKRFNETNALKQQTEQLNEQLETRKLLDRAKGRLMSQGMNEESAYLYLQKLARDRSQTIRQISEQLLAPKW